MQKLFKKETAHPLRVGYRKPARPHKLGLQVAGLGFDHSFVPAVLLAVSDELAQVPIQLKLLLVDLPQSAVLGSTTERAMARSYMLICCKARYWASRTRCFTAVSNW